MKAVYLSANDDQTTVLPFPLEVQGFGCGVLEIMEELQFLRIKIILIKKDLNNENLYLCCNIIEESFVGNF